MPDTPNPTTPTAEAELRDYLLSDEYRHLLRRAIYARIGTTSDHMDEHMRALALLDSVFPNDVGSSPAAMDIRELAKQLAQEHDVHIDRAEKAVRNLVARGLI